MILGPQLRHLREVILDWSQGVMADELGLTGKLSTQYLNEMEQDRRPISGPISKLAEHIAARHGYELNQNKWVRTDDR